ncbi:hypothetical protein Lesp02_70860 [Lentzea sp. NBRC 105346]|uniref:hypothetical protein n=1 Tax=Lentzea sp. NBRC 105346 TaxID=3032205 RepID=UPI0024A12F39|nr:hypothetical protein [Lentzea sp. NBRC 105346]GLZ34899.1 hypothetical protein Lesp02_70860 [Lentzea sp. NBRC 105346]
MTTTVGHIRGIITGDTSGLKAATRDARKDAREMKADVERQKPDIDANEKPFVAAVARAEAAKNALDDKIRKTITTLEANLQKAGDAEETALGRIRVAQAALDAVRDKSPEATDRITAAEERLAKAQRDLIAIQRDTSVMTDRLAQQRLKLVAVEDQLAAEREEAARTASKAADAEEEVADGADKSAKANDKAASSTAKHTSALNKLTIALFASHGAMLAGGLVAGAAVAALPVAAVAAAAVLLSSNQRVANSYTNLAAVVVDGAREMAAPLEDDLVHASEELATTWMRLKGPMASIFSDSQPAVRELSRGVNEFALNAVPGMADAVHRSEPVMIGWRKLFADTGAGIGDFFRNISSDTQSTGRNIEAFGQIIRTVLAAAGNLLQQLSSNFAPHAAQFALVFQQIMDVVTKFAAGALPVLSDALGVTLDVLQAVLSVVEPISGALGSMTGVILTAAAAWKVYSAAIMLVSKVPLASALTASTAAAAPAGGILARLGLGASGAAAGATALTGALSPLGIALGATGLIMGAYLLEQQKIDRGADAFAQGILKGGDAARKTVDDYAALQNGLAALIKKRDDYLKAQGASPDDANLGQMNDQIAAMTANVTRATEKWNEYLASVGPVERAQAQLNLAIARHGKDSPEAARAAAIYRDEVQKQEAASRAASDAVKTHTDRVADQLSMMLQAAGASVSYDAALLSLESAQKNLNQAIKEHGPTSLEARTADNQYQQQLLLTVDALGKKVAAENEGKSAAEISTLVTQAQYGEILRLAAAAGDNAPAALTKMISHMDGATLAAMGVTVRVNEAGDAIITMPDGKEVKITGDNAKAMAAIAEVNAAAVREKTLYLNIITRADKPAVDWLTGGLNDGGWVPGSGPDEDDRLVPLTSKEFVVNRRAAAKWGPFLEAINKANGGDVKLPDSVMSRVPDLAVSSPSIPTPRAARSSGGGEFGGGMSSSPAKVDNRQFHFHEVKSLPSKKWLRDTLDDIERGVY